MTTRRFHTTNYAYTSGTSITIPSLIGSSSISSSNLSATLSRVSNFKCDTVTCSNLVLNNKIIYFSNLGSNNNGMSYFSTVDGPAILGQTGKISTWYGDNALTWNSTGICFGAPTARKSLDVVTLKSMNDITMPQNESSSLLFTSTGNYNVLTFYDGNFRSITPGYSGIGVGNNSGNIEISYLAAGYTSGSLTSTGSHVFFSDSYGISSGSNYTVRSALYVSSRTDGTSNCGIDYRSNSDDYINTENPLATFTVADINSTNTPIAYFENQSGSTYMRFGHNRFMGHNTSIANSFTDNFFINNNVAAGNNHIFITSTGSLVNGRITSLNNYLTNEPCIATSAADGIGRGTFGLGSSSSGQLNSFIQTSNGNFMFNSGNSDYVTTSGNLTLNVATLTSNGSLLLPTSSSLVVSNYFTTITGSTSITTTPSTYYITPGIQLGYTGYIACHSACLNGRHISMAPIIMPNSTTRRANLGAKTELNFGTYTAFLEPFGGSNSNATVSDSSANSVQFRVTNCATATTLYWYLTVLSSAS